MNIGHKRARCIPGPLDKEKNREYKRCRQAGVAWGETKFGILIPILIELGLPPDVQELVVRIRQPVQERQLWRHGLLFHNRRGLFAGARTVNEREKRQVRGKRREEKAAFL